ncbi:hypothetical protein ACTWQF_09490 [Streptomyces sp. 8N114]|uniref:hypothetical protein n=1 Tax=Streptomyces sp. 8N114 TaxID=3457419 RepID=UPI003FCF2431
MSDQDAGAFFEFGRYPHAAGPVGAEVGAQGAAPDGLEGAGGLHSGHGVDCLAPGGACLLDVVLLGLLLGSGDQVEGGDPRLRRVRTAGCRGGVLAGGVGAVDVGDRVLGLTGQVRASEV